MTDNPRVDISDESADDVNFYNFNFFGLCAL